MNRWDALAAWLYHRKSTHFQRVKSACRTLSFDEGFGEDWSPLGHASYWTRPLFELGFIEYDDRKQVVACPPGIITSKDNHALLSGYWVPERLAKLKQSGVRLFHKQQPERGPTCRFFVGDPDVIRDASIHCKVWLANDPGDEILKRLPAINQWLEALPEENSSLVGVWERFTFRDHRPTWVSSREPLSKPGFYRRRNGERIYVHVTARSKRRATTPDERCLAKWHESPRVLWIYDAAQNRLLLRMGVPRLPLLMARSLVAASGLVGTKIKYRNQSYWAYGNVTYKRAQRAAKLLGQDVVVMEQKIEQFTDA